MHCTPCGIILTVAIAVIDFTSILLANIRELEETFPVIPSEEDLIHYLLSQGKLEQLSEGGEYHSILRFAIDLKQLQVGGELLPDLIELYKWIHSNLSVLVTRHKATTITIKNVLDIAIKHASGDAGDHLRKLYERVVLNCRRYQYAETSATGSIETMKRKKKIVFNNNTSLLHFLSGL